MRDLKHACSIARRLGYISLVFLCGCSQPHRDAAKAPPSQAPAAAFSQDARLGANLYMQTSAEYEACCLTIYKCAECRLEEALRSGPPGPRKPAVVMDLDETVLDNSAFQSFLYQTGQEYSDELWAMYEGSYPGEVRLVPGAKGFIDKAEAMGVTVIYVSNRLEQFRTSTEKSLRDLGINDNGLAKRLLLKPGGGSSDKSERQKAVAAQYNVLMYLGDNLRDFSEAFAAAKLPKDADNEACLRAIRSRQLQVHREGGHWGVDWFVLPNPVYGDWDRLFGKDLKAALRPTQIVLPARSRPAAN